MADFDADVELAARVREFEEELVRSERQSKQERLRTGMLGKSEREGFLTQNLGPRAVPQKGEDFVIGDAEAGITGKSLWFSGRRVHFAVLTSVAVGEIVRDGLVSEYCIDLNCTLHRSFRISVPCMLDTDTFLVALSNLTSFKIVPTIEDAAVEQRKRDEQEAYLIVDANARQRRLEQIALAQTELLSALVLIEASPRVSFGILF